MGPFKLADSRFLNAGGDDSSLHFLSQLEPRTEGKYHRFRQLPHIRPEGSSVPCSPTYLSEKLP